MPILKKVFTGGKMNKDTDERLLPQGDFRHAENVMVVTSEGSDVGSIENVLSNKKLTNIQFVGDVYTIGKFSYETRKKIYWLCKDDLGCYLLEWDNQNQILTFVLKDTRPTNQRVLNLDKSKLITGIEILITENESKELLLWTDDNIDVCCINIKRAKTYGENGFEKEDIYLIKKNPLYAPVCTPILTGELSNFIEEKFILFAYRYKYLDGEYSVLSSFSNYQFNPKPYEIDYISADNIGMVNFFNGVNIEFKTGNKNVVQVQLVCKESNSNTLYIIETFDKLKNKWGDNQTKNFVFSNSKIYTALQEKELFRNFDNVPRKAKCLSLIENTLLLSNYLEQYNIIDKYNHNILLDFNVSHNSYDINENTNLSISFPAIDIFEFTNLTQVELKKENSIFFKIKVKYSINTPLSNGDAYNNEFLYILPQDFTSLTEMFLSDSFVSFWNGVNIHFNNNYNIPTLPSGWTINTDPKLLINSTGQFITQSPTYIDQNNASQVVYLSWDNLVTKVSHSNFSSSKSLKTNRNYEVGIIYIDEFHRKTIALTCPKNTTYIPQHKSDKINKLFININHIAPVWAKYYKICVKSQPLKYYNILINFFFTEGSFVWVKLEGANKDKIKEGDYLILKSTNNGVEPNIKKVKVLEIGYKDRDFIYQNTDPNTGILSSEPAGYYMKFKPTGFSMNFSAIQTLENTTDRREPRSNINAFNFLNLFSTFNNTTQSWEDRPLKAGSRITFDFDSSFNYDDGWSSHKYKETFILNQDYTSIEDWYNETILNRALLCEHGHDYKVGMGLYRGTLIYFGLSNEPTINPNSNQLWLRVQGHESGGSNGRAGFLNAKITLQVSGGDYLFETEPSKTIEQDLFYETEEVFTIDENGNHIGNIKHQDYDNSIPGQVETNFYNCFSHGNGVESYMIKDAFNQNALNIDTRPTTTSIEEYKEVRRFADATYSSEPFVESSGINGLNNFNLSTANWKELDKQYGSIQKTFSRDTNVVIIQEEKAGQVLFGKDLMYTAEGIPVMSKIPEILGQYIPYAGDNGIGLNPESFANDNFRLYYVNPKAGTPIRLSIDGSTPINNGMIDWFRDIFIKNPNSKKIGGYDPYHQLYTLNIEEEVFNPLVVNCGNTIYKSQLKTPYVYFLKLNNLQGEITINYNINNGNAVITCNFDNNTFSSGSVTGIGTFSFTRSTLAEDEVMIIITPQTQNVNVEITNLCPVGYEMILKQIVLADSSDNNTTINNRFKWGLSSFFNEEDTLQAPISKFITEIGVEGVGKFPANNSNILIQSYKNQSNNGRLKTNQCNRIGYLVSSTDYNQSQIETILQNANWLPITTENISQNSFLEKANFLFNRVSINEILYLIWDYTDRKPIANDDNVVLSEVGESQIINVLANDIANGGPITVTIITPPTNGTAVVNPDNTITYTHNGNNKEPDQLIYQISNGICTDTATIYIQIEIPVSLCISGYSAVAASVIGGTGNDHIEASVNLSAPAPYNMTFILTVQYGFTENCDQTQTINVTINQGEMLGERLVNMGTNIFTCGATMTEKPENLDFCTF